MGVQPVAAEVHQRSAGEIERPAWITVVRLRHRDERFDALEATFTEVALRKDPACPVCGENPTITEYVDYVEFCQAPSAG